MDTALRQKPGDVRSRLTELGLEEEPLKDVVRRGQLAFLSCTDNDPPVIPAIWAWGQTVRALREYLLPLGWRRSDEHNYSRVIDPASRIAVAVATGDEGTGRPDVSPSTKAPKGPITLEAVTLNQLQFAFVDGVPVATTPSDPNDDRVTWILLVHRATNEVRCELSLPSSMGPDGHIDAWRERILLGPIPLDGDMDEVVRARPLLPDITVNVKRRA